MTNLRNLRDAKSWSREELARRAGISAKTVEKHEIGHSTDVYKSVSSCLAAALGCDENVLFLPSNMRKHINPAPLEPEAQADLETAKHEHQTLTDMSLEDAPRTMADALRIARVTAVRQ